MEFIFSRCSDLNPRDETRPLRDGGWLRTQFSLLKSTISECFGRFTNTGQQDGSEFDKYDIWSRFAAQFSDVVCYSYSLLSHEAMINLGKLLPPTVARQTGILGGHKRSSKAPQCQPIVHKSQGSRSDERSREHDEQQHDEQQRLGEDDEFAVQWAKEREEIEYQQTGIIGSNYE
jgi:hypothetical protein